MKRAPELCPHSPDGRHVDVRIWQWRRWRRRIMSVCPRCDGWWAEHETLSEHNRTRNGAPV